MNVNTSEITPEGRKQTVDNVVNAAISFMDLPDDVLFTIFLYCDRQTLGRICCTCSRLRDLSSKDCVWGKESTFHTFMVCPVKDKQNERCSSQKKNTVDRKKRRLLKDQCRIAKNWAEKNYRGVQIVKHKSKLIPWVRLHRQRLYVSSAMNINCYNIYSNGTIQKDMTKTISESDTDVTRFVVNDDMIVSGFRDGGIMGIDTSTNRKLFEYDFRECGDTQAVAVYNHVVIAGYRDGSVKVINTTEDEVTGVTHLDNAINNSRNPNRVWSLATAQDGSTFTIGNAGHEKGRTPIEVHDLESCNLLYRLGTDCKRGAGVLDIKYETPQTILTCGYDTSLRLWDLRSQTCVKKWEEPFDTELSSLQSDGNNVIVTGTFQYGMTRLWDKRSRDPIQIFYSGKKRSPVYCLDTDFERLFIALDVEICMLDFTTYSTSVKH